MSTRLLTIAATAWCATSAVLLVAGMWLLLAGRLNARHRAGQRVSGIALTVRWGLVAVGWPLVLLGCIVTGVRARFRDSTGRLVAAGRDAAVVADVRTHRQLEKDVSAMGQEPWGRVDHGVPQLAPFRVGQRIRHTHAGPGVVIAVLVKDASDPRGSVSSGR